MPVFQISLLIPGPISAQIGRICAHWTFLELVVERLIWRLSGIGPKEGRMLTAKENILPRIRRLKAVAKTKLSQEHMTELRAICGNIKIASKKRNWAVHGGYGIGSDGKMHAIYYRENPSKGAAYPVSVDVLRSIKGEIYQAIKALQRLELSLEFAGHA